MQTCAGRCWEAKGVMMPAMSEAMTVETASWGGLLSGPWAYPAAQTGLPSPKIGGTASAVLCVSSVKPSFPRLPFRICKKNRTICTYTAQLQVIFMGDTWPNSTIFWGTHIISLCLAGCYPPWNAKRVTCARSCRGSPLLDDIFTCDSADSRRLTWWYYALIQYVG